MAKICPTCGGESPDDANFCVKCGIPYEQLKANETAEPAEAAAEPEQYTDIAEEVVTEADEAAIDYQEQKTIGEIELTEAVAEEQLNEDEKATSEMVPEIKPENEAVITTELIEQPENNDNAVRQDDKQKYPGIQELFVDDSDYGDEAPPPKKSPYSPMSSVGTALSIIALNIPVIGFVLAIIWACGGCRKIGRRNLARAQLILIVVSIILIIMAAILAKFVFADTITEYFESIYPGYTIIWE